MDLLYRRVVETSREYRASTKLWDTHRRDCADCTYATKHSMPTRYCEVGWELIKRATAARVARDNAKEARANRAMAGQIELF